MGSHSRLDDEAGQQKEKGEGKRLKPVAILSKIWGMRASRSLVLLSIAVLLFSFFVKFPRQEQSVIAVLERLSFDVQMRVMREYYPRELADEPVLIGIDEAAEEVFEEPLAMWHQHLGNTMLALADARPAVVGMDIQLPPRSFDNMRPGLDLALTRGLVLLKRTTPLVVAHSIDRAGYMAKIHDPFLRMLGDETFAVDKTLEDPDRVARRFSETAVVREGTMPVFAAEIARKIGRPISEGYIDFSTGGLIRYVPIQQVLAWRADGNTEELRRRFRGRVVLLGSVGRSQDRWFLPVGISDWERDTIGGTQELSINQPGITVHYQVLRNLLDEGMLRPIPPWLKWLVCAALFAMVFVPSNRRTYLFAFALAPLALFTASVLLILAHWYIPAVTFLAVLWISVAVSAVAEGMRTLNEKNRFRQHFSGSVSPAVLEEMMAGNLSAGVSAKTADICVMFSDIRDFTGLSESLPAEKVTDLLTRYFDGMVACVHRHHGTMDKFMGDGMMVLFGAPRSLGNSCVNAVRCGLDMVDALTRLNAEFAAEGLPTIQIGIGINYGKVVVGNIGSTERHNYSAIGDAVNVASRLEGLTKRLGTPLVITDPVKTRLDVAFELIDFGEQALRGHSPMRVWGVREAVKQQ